MNRKAWPAAVHGFQSRTQLSDWTELNWTDHQGAASCFPEVSRACAGSLSWEAWLFVQCLPGSVSLTLRVLSRDWAELDLSDLQLPGLHSEETQVQCPLQDRLQQDVNHELPNVQTGFRKGRGIRDQIANIRWIIEKAREFQKNIYFCFIDYAKAFDCVDHNKLWKTLQEMGIPDHLTCLLRNLYAGQEATVRTGHGTTDWFQISKGVCQGWILSPSLFNLYAEYIVRNAELDEAQAGLKVAERNINNLRHADDTTLKAESKELKSLFMEVKEESEKVGLKLNIQKTKIMASASHHFMANRWGNSANSVRLYFSGLQNHCRWWLQPWH